MTTNRYKARLTRQSRGAPIPTLKGVPILLTTGINEDDEDAKFIRWVHPTRHFSSMMALRTSANAADARLGYKIRFDNAELKAKGKIHTSLVHYATVEQHVIALATAVPRAYVGMLM